MATKTDDPTKRYSDSELDPANRAFQRIVDGYGKSADSSAEDENIKHLKDREQNPEDPSTIASGAADPNKEASNTYNYSPGGKKKEPFMARFSQNRKKAAVIGVGGGTIGITALALILSLLPLKIPGIMSMITDEAGQRLEQIVDRRARLVVARAIMQKFATSGSGAVVTGEGPLASLIASMRTNGFEKKLAARGLTIENGNGGVRLRVNGELLEGGKTLRTDAEILKAMDGNRVTNKMLKTIVKEEIPAWRLMKKAKFAKWLRWKYGIPRYGITNSEESDTDKARAEMEKNRLTNEFNMANANNVEFLDCLSSGGESCTLTNDGDDTGSGNGSKNSDDISDTLESSSSEAIDEATKPENIGKNNSEIMTKILVGKFAAKAVPFVGWIDAAATAQHLIRQEAETGFIGKAVSGLKERNQAQLYGNWSGYASQIELGAMRPDYIGVLATQADGVEKAQAFQMIEGNRNASVATLGGATAYAANSDIPGTPVDPINSNKESPIQAKMNDFNKSSSGLAGMGGKAATANLELWYNTIGEGGILGKVSEWITKGVLTVTPEFAKDWFEGIAAKLFEKIIALFGLDFNPMATGAKLYNLAHGGATAALNTYCREIGCHKLSVAQASAQNQLIASEKADYLKQKGPLYALFSTEYSHSLSNQMAIKTSGDMSENIGSIASFVLGAPGRIIAGNTLQTKAANPYIDLHGIDPYGATTADLNAPLSDQILKGEECPEVPEGTFNSCTIDEEVIESMLCGLGEESKDCFLDGSNTVISEDSSTFTVASYNILHSGSHTEKSNALGGCTKNPVPGDPTCAKTRGARQVEIITGQAGNPAFDIVGTQETSPEQFNYLKNNLPGYAAFPESTERMNNADDGAVGLFWNTSKFTMIESGKAPGRSNTSKPISNPWVGLQATSGQKIYVMSIHYAISGYGGTPESIKESSRLTTDWVRSKLADNAVVIVVGDFNDRLNERNHYCVYTQGGLMQNAIDMAAGAKASAGCNTYRTNSIDHIYATPTASITTDSWKQMKKIGIVAKASDHSPVYTTYSFPGAGGGSISPADGTWSWPLSEQVWKDHRSEFLGSHYGGGGFLGSGNSSVDISWGSGDDGAPIYSMLDGVVVQQPLGRSSYQCTGTPNSPNNGGMLIKSVLNGKTVRIAYAHGSNPQFSVGDTVKSGDQILKLGNVGNSCGSHLHMDMEYDGKSVCPQDVFLAMDKRESPNLATLAGKATVTCAGR